MLNSRQYRKAVLRHKVNQLVEAFGGPGFAARYLEVSFDTVQRWLDEKTHPTKADYLALAVGAGRHPLMLERHWWDGFRFCEDGLLWREGWGRGINGYEIDNLVRVMDRNRALHQSLEAAQAELRRLRAELDAVDIAANGRDYRDAV